MKRRLSERRISEFRELVYAHYRQMGRHDLPWRKTKDPYRILVSEMMLQQTQVPRVLERYGPFLDEFPDILSLSRAPLRRVLRSWSGLGYNRRALMLRRAALETVHRFGGRLPRDFESLITLPGIGRATAGAVCAFAFGEAHPFIETNIRTVFIHHFFPSEEGVPDSRILPIVDKTLDRGDPRSWYYALMDYGVGLKKRYPNPSRKSAHHAKQSAFEGSDRQARGRIVKALTELNLDRRGLARETGLERERLSRNLARLEREGFVVSEKGKYRIAR
jgi:A/G-specific adenine glycosylase